jgi:peroxiredoxin
MRYPLIRPKLFGFSLGLPRSQVDRVTVAPASLPASTPARIDGSRQGCRRYPNAAPATKKLGHACLILLSILLALAMPAAHAATPDIALPDLDGRPRNVNEFIGHGPWVVVVFWSHDCRICATEIHNMESFHEKHRAKDAIVLGITLDGASYVDQARQFVAEHHLSFVNLLAEPDAAVVPRFGGGKFVGTPTYYFFDPNGRIVGRKIGPISGADIEEFIEAFNSSPYAVSQPAQ